MVLFYLRFLRQKVASDIAPYIGTAVLGEGDPYNFAYKYNALVSNITAT